MNQRILIVLLAALITNTYAATCPDIKATAKCELNTWKLNYNYPAFPWFRYNENVSGEPCNTPNEITQNSTWNYAMEHARDMFCSYNVLNNEFKVIGSFQIESTAYRHAGKNWQTTYPDTLECRESQVTCQMSRLIGRVI